MGERVWQVQKELEELQARSHGSAEVQPRLTCCTVHIRPGPHTSHL